MDLGLFLQAQEPVYGEVVAELRAARKRGHWIWFIFPQVRGLGLSGMSHLYGIESLDHARAYLAHPVLAARLEECTHLILAAGLPAEQVMGSLDAMKLRSSMTLFALAAGPQSLYARAIDQLFGGQMDHRTLDLLGLG